MRNAAESRVRMASASLAGVAVLLGLTQGLRAEVRYHLVLLPGGAGQVTNTGIVLSGRALLEPARDAMGNPVWDSDGDGVADGYETRWLTIGGYDGAHATRVNEELGVAVGQAWNASTAHPVLWTNIGTANGDGTFGTLVDLGLSHTARRGIAMDVNSRGHVVVRQQYRDHPVAPSWFTSGLVLVNPKDTNGDYVPDLWFEDLNGDGGNDLMIDLEGTSIGGCSNCALRVNELGQIAGKSNFMGGFVLLPEDTNGDGQPDVWFRDSNIDLVNDLQISLGGTANDISDNGRVVGGTGGSAKKEKKYLAQWQIEPPDQVNLVVQEWVNNGGAFHAINENLQAVGALRHNRTIYANGFLWENGQRLDLVELLDNPENAEILVPGSINDSGTITGSNCRHDPSVKIVCGEGFIAVPIAPTPPPVCGDGACDPGEDECNCPADCGPPPTSETSCSDGMDNDCDGLVDCDDTVDCGGDPSCACGAKGDPCTSDGDCCSNACKRNGTCR